MFKIKVFIINITIIIFIFILIELFYIIKYIQIKDESSIFCAKEYINLIINPIKDDEYFDNLYNKIEMKNVYTPFFRKDYNTTSKQKPILFMGCSFAWGWLLNEEETLSAQFAKKTGRATYNRSGSGWGLSQLLYLARNNRFYQDIPEPEYIIYIFISDQLYRLESQKENPITLNFKPQYVLKEGNKLIKKQPKFYDRFLFVSDYKLFNSYKKANNEYLDKLCKIYFINAQNEIKKTWKNTKFVIIKYPTNFNDHHLNSSIWKDLEKNGFIVINAQDLVKDNLLDIKYKTSDNEHPNKKAWEIIIPELIKELDLK